MLDRDFFRNWSAGRPPNRCAGAEGHNTPTIGGFVMLPPVILSSMGKVCVLPSRVEDVCALARCPHCPRLP